VDPNSLINERVEVITGFYKDRPVHKIALPLKMKYKNREIKFTQLGLRHPTMQGNRMVHVFDMSDGICDYRLEFDAEALTWTLVAMIDSSGK
jgi:hypothetical protein